MLLTVDVGNTNIALGLMKGNETVGRYRLMTQTTRTSDEYGFFIMTFMNQAGISPEDIEDVIISSVVPKLMYSLTAAMIKYVKRKPIIVSGLLDTGIKLGMEHPSTVGADRIVNTTWAWHTYHRSAIVVDFGTATTFDYIDGNGVFKYVTIMPGLGISLHALTASAAKLPEIEIAKPSSVLGRNTVNGMQAGAVYGYIGAVEYVIKAMKKELNDPDALVFATGGLGKVIANETDAINAYDPDIAYKGMKIIHDLIKEQNSQ